MFFRASIASIVAIFSLGTLSAAELSVPAGAPIDEGYRLQFAQCDAHNTFNGVQFPIVRHGRTIWYGCHSDPSRFARFERFAAAAGAPETVLVQSKLGWDEDGSPKACSGAHGVTDQCTTSLMLGASADSPCVISNPSGKECIPLNADLILYVVIPAAAPHGIEPNAFSRLAKVKLGDYGVVIANGKVVPVIVGDEGPAYKIGEGSTGLLRALSNDGKVHTYSSDVNFLLFPGTADPRGSLSVQALPGVIATKGNALYSQFSAGHH
jgi:hypothetical protein